MAPACLAVGGAHRMIVPAREVCKTRSRIALEVLHPNVRLHRRTCQLEGQALAVGREARILVHGLSDMQGLGLSPAIQPEYLVGKRRFLRAGIDESPSAGKVEIALPLLGAADVFQYRPGRSGHREAVEVKRHNEE